MMHIKKYLVLWMLLFTSALMVCASEMKVKIQNPILPILLNKNYNPAIRLDFIRPDKKKYKLNELDFNLAGTLDAKNINSIRVCCANSKGNIDTTRVLATILVNSNKVNIKTDYDIDSDTLSVWVSVKVVNVSDLNKTIKINCEQVIVNESSVKFYPTSECKSLRLGIAVHQHGQDGVNTTRIPGLITSKNGTLMAVFDARWDSGRDLQGNIDIGLKRSFDKGLTWQPLQIVLDMGTWGGLPQKYNGVSDACILVDNQSGEIFIAGLWMHGVLDGNTGKWVEGLTEKSDNWIHQWSKKGSQPGLDVKSTCQFLITKSTDDGNTWSKPMNITSTTKRPEWWLFAPAPGHGITLDDGTLVMPTQGRDNTGKPFSNITLSKDHGKTWETSNPAFYDVSECMAVELKNGNIMLNMRDNKNRKDTLINGRRICVTPDRGQTWSESPTSRKALIEPTCMGCIHRHKYWVNGREKSVLFFSNPNDKSQRINLTIKVSFDEGNTWPQKNWITLDEYKSAGYSCLTSIDDNTLGVLYESSQADLVFQQINIEEILKQNEK